MSKNHTPNFYPRTQRFACLFFSIVLIAYAGISIYYDDFAIPSKRRVLHLHGYPAWVMLLAFVAAAANLLSLFIDHYDKRDNEHKYKSFSRFSRMVGWFFFIAALILQVMHRV